jgi:NTP pyrophosphatase (non-canonical NTP hydrolase)
MKLSELVELQRNFDSRRTTTFEWSSRIDADDLHPLLHNVVSLSGEVGEIANLVKKLDRGDLSFQTLMAALPGELADVFIYVMKIAYQSGIDLEDAVLAKIADNEARFPITSTSNFYGPEFSHPVFVNASSIAEHLDTAEIESLRLIYRRSGLASPGSPSELVAAGLLAIRVGELAELEGDHRDQKIIWDQIQPAAEKLGLSYTQLVNLARRDVELRGLLVVDGTGHPPALVR